MRNWKVMMMLLLVLGIVQGSRGQGLGTFFRQNETQKKYLLEQIAAFRVYSGYLAKGYSIAKDGLGTIDKIKSGELGLHDLYYTSLKNVNPVIARSAQAKDIIRLQGAIANVGKQAKNSLKSSNHFTAEEQRYIREVYERLAKDCNIVLDELLMITSTGTLQLTDDERIRRMDSLHSQSLVQHQFAIGFSNEMRSLQLSREQEQKDISFNKSIKGLK